MANIRGISSRLPSFHRVNPSRKASGKRGAMRRVFTLLAVTAFLGLLLPVIPASASSPLTVTSVVDNGAIFGAGHGHQYVVTVAGFASDPNSPANVKYDYQCPNGLTQTQTIAYSGSSRPNTVTFSASCFSDGDTSAATLAGLRVTDVDNANFVFYSSGVYFVPPPDVAPTGTGNACTISDSALVRLARGAGFAEAQIQTMVAIALAESGGTVNKLHANGTTSYDIGLWQINDVAHPTYNKNLLYTSPGYNATAAFQIYSATSGGGYGNWTTYNTGAYNAFMSRAASALQGASVGTLGGNSCADLTSDFADTGGTTNADGTDNGCSWSLNIFKDMKCAFQWALVPSSGTMNQWSTQLNQMQNNPPLSTATSVWGSVTNIITAFNSSANTVTPIGSSASCTTSNCEATNATGVGLKYAHLGTAYPTNGGATPCDTNCFTVIPILSTAGDQMHSNVYYGYFYTGMQAMITLGFCYYWYNRITSAVGSKNDA